MAISVGYIVGSNSSQSINRQVVDALMRIDRETAQAENADPLEFTEIPIGDLPLYNYDRDESYPPEAVELKDAIRYPQPDRRRRPTRGNRKDSGVNWTASGVLVSERVNLDFDVSAIRTVAS